ncbi:sensor histidine kinase [Phenylobacterium sp.]|uniref:sensor histidine kinase n=1 Tax=Phenylobacterium sp. TaxID=1871053 RepID=UPI002BB6B334|nr:HWE histidine kinase domain-containing protein [Phenylobacterium sp.]HLZ76354.1 HWE histidine kinase domain-containing protein [Phenylobacterium sp.]
MKTASATPPGETTERPDAALRQTEEQLEFALHAGRMGSWELDLATRRFTTSEYCRVVFGLGPDDPFETVEDLTALIVPEDRQKRQDAIARAIADHTEMEVEYRTHRPDGSIGWVLARGRAAYEDGRAVRMAGISLDITDRRAAQERQTLLINELNHRVKNTLATVQSLASQTYRGAGDPAAAGEAFLERLMALARVHDLLSEAAWDGASLHDVAERTLTPYRRDGVRLTASGPMVHLAPNAAVTLNLAFHELATNAVKHGALSSPTGAIDIAWAAEGGELTIDWRESGGPPVVQPERRGFGSRLIERGLGHELGGEAQLIFRPEGLSCHIRAPLGGKLRLAG